MARISDWKVSGARSLRLRRDAVAVADVLGTGKILDFYLTIAATRLSAVSRPYERTPFCCPRSAAAMNGVLNEVINEVI
jgi:hypothetical protein